MSSSNRHDEPVYYREIQKNAYLKRIPLDSGGSKLRPLGHKKAPLKPMWTLFCVHNGRIPFLEQYPEPDSPATLNHAPSWRVCLGDCRHVTASVTPHQGQQYDFLVDTQRGAVRLLASDWESMQDWVNTLRTKLHELKVLSKCENVYGTPRPPPQPRAAARDPMSPLPPPPARPDRVPGIELPPQLLSTPQTESTPEPIAETETSQPTDTSEDTPQPANQVIEPENIDISNWDDQEFTSLPSTSQNKLEPKKSVTKICGQNICLDDSILKRTQISATDSDDEFFSEIDRISDSVENLCFDDSIDNKVEFTQKFVIGNGEHETNVTCASSNVNSDSQASNVTVIQVSNKAAPHTAIPVLGPETNVFNFEFKQNVNVEAETSNNDSFINIVNTASTENGYGTVFSENNSDYGHVSLMTTVNVTDVKVTDVKVTPASKDEGVYERLCQASTSTKSPLIVRKLKHVDQKRKSSLPNLDVATSESTYEYLFPGNSNVHSQTVTVNRVENVPNSNSNNEQVDNSVTVLNSDIDIPRNANHVNQVNVNHSTRVVRANVERSHSQNACDSPPRLREPLIRRVQNNSPKRDGKTDKTEATTKPIWKRGLTELSFLSRLRGIAQTKRQDDTNDRNPTVAVKVIHRSRPEARVDPARRRSNSLTNGRSPTNRPHLVPLVSRQAHTLQLEQRRGAAAVSVNVAQVPACCRHEGSLWVARWGPNECRRGGKIGDRIVGVAGTQVSTPQQFANVLASCRKPVVDILYQRVPLGKICVISKRDREGIGIKLDGECNITCVEANSPASRVSLPSGKWAVTEVNGRPINLIKGGEEEMNRICFHGTEASILIQPSALVKKIRQVIKSNKNILSFR